MIAAMALMRPEHEKAFLKAAKEFTCYILVRPVNEFSDPYIGKDGYVPKPLECKAKTSNVLDSTGTRKHAGLVVNPRKFAGAFKDGKHKSAIEMWDYTLAHDTQKSLKEDDDPKSPHFGCVKYKGSYLYGDYDPYDIIPADDPTSNTAKAKEHFGHIDYRGPMVDEVQAFLNTEIKVPMVQHGAEAQFQDHSKQFLYFFGPHGENTVWLNELTARVRYFEDFAGRETLTKGHSPNPNKPTQQWNDALGFKKYKV